ncbi:formylglycine-generating enzyme family protein [Rubinisphaera sp.]|uniref:formylglycine-generating enzyme family protein n=1 Tax=Rubinisphaera sp. TaxID=2024857 RepID=UPI000C11EA11|nr:formylglycine-generating enzyme family protein [Rubinisphaera sp.]MBV11160.1 hypothetical protein [Rubinisphaera sp.]|tara:strand:+ start:143 stop:1105 length:963 start_codon:yes stop_codon:yes gene_type:complete
MSNFNKETTQTLPEQLTLPLSPEVFMEFRLIPPGRFRMGSCYSSTDEQPVHWVEMPRPYYMGIYPVTQEQFAVWTKSACIDHKNEFPGHADHPAENINWETACDYCEWLTRERQSLQTQGYLAGLPSEAQWEYACRAGTETEYYSGDGEAALSAAGWFGNNSENKTHPAGKKEANMFGLCDMHGNVWEWCGDVWDEFAYSKRVDGVQDPVVKSSEILESEEFAYRVLRGGSWFISASGCNASSRNWARPEFRSRDHGFRVCLFLVGYAEEQDSAGAESEPVPGEAERREAETQSQGTGGEGAEVNLGESHFPSRSNGTRF